MKLLQINDIKLDQPLFFENEFRLILITAKADEAIDGSEIVFESYIKNEALNFTHKDVSWQSKSTVLALKDLANSSLGKELSIKTDKGSVKARFDYTKNAVVGSELFVGSNYFLVEVFLKRI